MQPKISVNIITYNRAHYLNRAIISVLSQSFSDFELIIVDDASSDKTKELISSFNDRRIRYFYVSKQKNIPAVRNIALSKSSGEYIAVLDSDDIWLDIEKLEKQINFLKSNSDYVLVGSGAIVIDEKGNEKRKTLKPKNNQDIRKDFLLKNPFFHSSVLYKKDIAMKYGGYNEDIIYGEDLDLWLHLGQLGKLYNFSEFFIKYREHSGNESVINFSKAVKGVFQIIKKYRKVYGFNRLIYIKKIWQKIREKFNL